MVLGGSWRDFGVPPKNFQRKWGFKKVEEQIMVGAADLAES